MIVLRINSSQQGVNLSLGRRGENAVRQVIFDYSGWKAAYGSGVVTLLVKRSTDTAAYPVSLTYDGDTAIWTVSATDTDKVGNGVAEFKYTVDEQIAKSALFGINVQQDLGAPTTDPPDPYETWLDELEDLEAATLQNAQDAHAAQTAAETAQGKAEDAQEAAEAALAEFTTPTASAVTLAAGSSATASYSGGHFTFGVPKGDKGATGATGAQGPQGEQGPQGIQGLQGETGATGADGAAATVAVGTVTTGEPGTDAAVTNTGTSTAAVLNFTIPRGATGATGQTGPAGADGADGQDGAPGQDGADGVTFTPAVSAAGVLSWTNDGGRENPSPVDIAAAVGDALEVTVSGANPSITAESNHRYLCGTVSTLSFTPSASGICECIFTSGATAAVLTLPNTVLMPEWWTGCEANQIYDISIVDGVYGAVMAWPST